MDIPTYIIIALFLVGISSIIFFRFVRPDHGRSLGIVLLTLWLMWFFMTLMGEFMYAWGGNATCSVYIGCVAGFFGYDALEHLCSGAAMALTFIWLSLRYPTYSIIQHNVWKTVLMIIATATFVAVLWEIGECAHDLVRLDVFHQPLYNIRLHVNLLDQPTNLDTMGDLIFNHIGSIIALFLSTVKTTELRPNTKII